MLPVEPMTDKAAAQAGPVCSHNACTLPGVVQWARRPAQGEIDALPPDDQATAATSTTVAVFACAAHAITPALGAHIHAASCPGPNAAGLPQCGCTVEPLPAPEPLPPATPMPTGW